MAIEKLAAVLKLDEAAVAAWKTASEYEQAVKSIQVNTGATGRKIQELEKQFRSVMKEVPHATGEVAGVIAHLEHWTSASGDVMHALTRQILDLSRMLKEDAAGNAEAFGQALTLWQQPAEEAGAILDGMFKLSQDTGIGFGKLANDLNSYGAGMQLAGFSMTETADLFGRLHAQGIDVSKVMPGLNKSFQQWAGEHKDSRQELTKTIQAMQNAESSADALTIATGVFGKDGAEQLVATVRNGSLALDGLAGSFEGAGGSIARYAEETMSIDDRMQRLKNQLFQVIEPYGEKMIEQAEKAVKYFDENGPQMIAIAEEVAKALAGIGVAAGTIKIGKGIMNAGTFIGNLTKVGTAAASTGAGVGGIATSTRVLGAGLRALSGPIGWTLTGITLMSAGWSTYKKHQENARQELLHMGADLEEASSQHDFAEEKAKITNDLVWEYRNLHDIVQKNTDSSKDLTVQQGRLVEIEQTLQDMFPNTITQYDIERGRVIEKIDLLKQEADHELNLMKMRLESEVLAKSHSYPDLLKEIASLESHSEKLIMEKDAIDAAIPAITGIYAEYQKVAALKPSDEKSSHLEELHAQMQEIGETLGESLGLHDLNNGIIIDQLKNRQIEKYDEHVKTMEELSAAMGSVEEYYEQQVNVIELELGGSIEELTAKYADLSEEEQQRLKDAVVKISEIQTEMDLIPDDKIIDIKAVWRQIGAIPDDPSIPLSARYSMVRAYAEGGFSDRPAIFGEAGLEAAIPINNKPRSHAILDRVNQMMGHDTGGNVQITFAPDIRLAVGNNAQDVRGQVQSAIREAQAEFERRFREMVRQERRLSFHV